MIDCMNGRSSTGNRISWVQLGGSLGIAGSCIGLAIFIAGCFGVSAAFSLSIIPLAMGAVATVLVTLGGWIRHESDLGSTAPMAAVFPALMSLLGGLILLATWLNWPILPGGGAGM